MAESSFTFSGDVRPVCQVGMSDVRQDEPDSWLDVSCYVHEAELFRGRERFNDRFQPGTATITFSNDNGWADLVGDYTQIELTTLRPGRQIRVGVAGPFDDGPVTTRWLWRGYIDQARPDYDPVAHDVVTVNCIDAFGEAGHTQLLRGPLVGVNEPVHTRIHRVLDAVGWWTGKRVINTGTALMQGSTLDGQVSDLLTRPADSAGGIVYGDTDGNIVFKDFNWELYDPDTPPDGEIGNATPGSPTSPATPPYLDPTPGAVYDPDPPPPTHPAITHVCPQGDAGTLIEQGEAYRIYVDAPPGTPAGADYQPHLYLEENGHTFDMGEWTVDSGCTTITHGPAPTRVDDKDPTITIPGVEIPPEDMFTVDLLGWDDGNTSTDVVTVAGITPGTDCLLVVLACAICEAGVLSPFPDAGGSITGGGLTWDEIAREVAGTNGAESHAAVAAVGRTDPGTFDVVVDWQGAHRSTFHIVTVWRVTQAVADMAERMAAGAYLHAFTWDRPSGVTPSPINPPGKGPFVLPLESGSDMPPYPRLYDITIAQSLAESPTGPYGATFDDSDGPWTVPPLSPPTPAVFAVEWVDDFERADGAIGPNWVTSLAPGGAWGGGTVPFVIDGGAAIAAGAERTSSMHWHEPQGADQAVEIELTAMVGNAGYGQLYTHANDTDYACNFCDFFINGAGVVTVAIFHFNADGTYETAGYVAGPVPVTEPFRLRFEADAAGEQRFLVNDTLIHSRIDADPRVGDFVGMGLETGVGSTPQRIERVAVGGGRSKKCSWVAGWRPNSSAPNAAWSEVNTGPDDIQSCQACVVVEPLWPDQFGWRVLAYRAEANDPGIGTLVPPLSRSSSVRYQRNSIIVVYVAAFAATDITAGITIASSAGLTFAVADTQPRVAPSYAQGRVFWAKTPELATPSDTITVTWANSLDGVSYLIYEVTNGDTVAAVGSDVFGSGGGSITGGVSATLSAAPATSSVVLGFLGALGEPNDAGAIPGSGWIEEIEYLPAGTWTWFQAQSRIGSAATLVDWADANASSSADISDVVTLAVEITPGPDYVNWETTDPLVIGGSQDAFNGPIYSAEARNADGSIIWSFDPGDFV